jgi:hypothetical protein
MSNICQLSLSPPTEPPPPFHTNMGMAPSANGSFLYHIWYWASSVEHNAPYRNPPCRLTYESRSIGSCIKYFRHSHYFQRKLLFILTTAPPPNCIGNISYWNCKRKKYVYTKLEIKFRQLTHNPFHTNTTPLQTQRTQLVCGSLNLERNHLLLNEKTTC